MFQSEKRLVTAVMCAINMGIDRLQAYQSLDDAWLGILGIISCVEAEETVETDPDLLRQRGLAFAQRWQVDPDKKGSG